MRSCSEPKTALYYRLRGEYWSKAGDFDKALADFDAAIRLEPDSHVNYTWRGYECLVKQQYDQAITDLDAAIRLDPKDVDAHVYRGGAWHAKKQFESPLPIWTPRYASIHKMSTPTSIAETRGTRRDNTIGPSPILTPRYASIQRCRRSRLSRNHVECEKQYDPAIADYDPAIRLSPKSTEAMINRSSAAFLNAKQPEKAISDANRVIELDP